MRKSYPQKSATVNRYDDPPENLKDHIFYGLLLDEDQKVFRDRIWSDNYDIIFCDSKAGTGKTLISLGVANLLYEHGLCDGIVYIVSPIQEEKIGYLPGTAEEKIAPYLEPIKDALLKLNINPEIAVKQLCQDPKMVGDAYIDCISHIYLRGTNFGNKVIIIDESQNMYLDEMRKTLTRVSDSDKVIVIGHAGQCDIYKNPERSGFVFYKEWFRECPKAAVCTLSVNHRGWVAQRADDINLGSIYASLKKV